MRKVEIEIEDGVLDGYEIVGLRPVSYGESYIGADGRVEIWDHPVASRSSALVVKKETVWHKAEFCHLSKCPRRARFRTSYGSWVEGVLIGWSKEDGEDNVNWERNDGGHYEHCEVVDE